MLILNNTAAESAGYPSLPLKELKQDPKKIAAVLGLGDLGKQRLIRIDVPNPWLFSPRLPTPGLSGTNRFFLEGGKTVGGLNEIVIDPVPISATRETILGGGVH